MLDRGPGEVNESSGVSDKVAECPKSGEWLNPPAPWGKGHSAGGIRPLHGDAEVSSPRTFTVAGARSSGWHCPCLTFRYGHQLGGTRVETTAQSKNVLLLATEQKVYGFDLVETFRVAIGRHDSNDLCFDSRNVSNYHAEILNEAHGLTLRDLGSTNGTFVNGERVRERKLAHGDQLKIGNNEIRVRLTTSDDEANDVSALEDDQIGRQGEFGKADGNGAMTVRRLLLDNGAGALVQ